MVTMKEIADELGVSVMTVSRVVNGHYSKVSDANIQKVQALIKKYNYVPNSTARSLSSKSSRIASLVIRGYENVFINPYNAVLTGYIADLVQEHGFYLMIHVIEKYQDITKRLHAWNSAGAIFIGAFDDDIQPIMFDNKMPLIFTDSYSDVRQANNIGIDDKKGGELAAAHFIEQGHERLAFIGSSFRSQVIMQRLEGFREILSAHGITLDDALVFEMDRPMADIVRSIHEHPSSPTGVFLTADQLAQDFVHACRQAAIGVPDELSVIGFDDLPLSLYTSPALTTVRQDLAQKAKYAVDALFQQIHDTAHPATHLTLDVTLVERDSVKKLR